jgi:hypothetical protein
VLRRGKEIVQITCSKNKKERKDKSAGRQAACQSGELPAALGGMVSLSRSTVKRIGFKTVIVCSCLKGPISMRRQRNESCATQRPIGCPRQRTGTVDRPARSSAAPRAPPTVGRGRGRDGVEAAHAARDGAPPNCKPHPSNTNVVQKRFRSCVGVMVVCKNEWWSHVNLGSEESRVHRN